MAAIVSVEVGDIASQILAVSPSTNVAQGVWKLGDTLPAGDDIAKTTLYVGPGFTGSLSMDLVSPAGSTGTSSVKMFRRYRDEYGATLSQVDSAAISVVAGTPVTTILALSAAPAGVVSCELGLYSNMSPPGNPVRTNLFFNPRTTSTAGFAARNGWSLTAHSGATPPVAGLDTIVRANAIAETATNRGLDVFQAYDLTNPTAGVGMVVTAGQTITLSCWTFSQRAGDYRIVARGSNGAAWTSAAINGSLVAVAANTYTRVSATFVIPAGTTRLSWSLINTTSVAWVVGNYIIMTALLAEYAGAVDTYFDGTTVNGIASSSVRWEDVANNSQSLLYAGSKPGGTTVQATAAMLTYGATCEDLLGAALERDLRRSVADIWNAPGALITAGTPGLLAGQLTFLCSSLAEARSLDSVYRQPGLVTLDSADELAGLRHRAVGRSRMTPERSLPGRAAKWLLVVDFREQAAI